MAGISAVQDLRSTLRREIVEQYSAGDYMPNERELAERFGVARNTIRETMIHLEAFGLIEKTKRGARVCEPNFDPIFEVFSQHFDHSAERMADVLNFRRVVETGAATLCVTGADEAILTRMAEANQRMAEAVTVGQAANHDYDFHFALVEAARNDVLTRMYRVMAVALRFYLEIGKSHRHDTEAAFAQHQAIIDAIRAGDAVTLASHLNTHFDHSRIVFAASGLPQNLSSIDLGGSQ